MTVPSSAWKLAKKNHANLSGEGARLYGGRWNTPGHSMVYMCQEASLTVLEVLVHLDLSTELIPNDYVLMQIDLSVIKGRRNQKVLEEGPTFNNEKKSQAFGDKWIKEKRSLLLRVPSVIVPHSFNLLLNPEHVLAKQIPKPVITAFNLDSRLFA